MKQLLILYCSISTTVSQVHRYTYSICIVALTAAATAWSVRKSTQSLFNQVTLDMDRFVVWFNQASFPFIAIFVLVAVCSLSTPNRITFHFSFQLWPDVGCPTYQQIIPTDDTKQQQIFFLPPLSIMQSFCRWFGPSSVYIACRDSRFPASTLANA